MIHDTTKLDTKKLESILSFSKFYESTKSSVNISSPRGAVVTLALEQLQNELKVILTKSFPPFTFNVSFSRGKPSIPRILWLSITLNRTKVSSAPSYSILFGRKGDGFVHGLMISALCNTTDLKPINRTTLPLFIDVDGNSNSIHYNNKFINPQDVYMKDFDNSLFFNHMNQSLQLLLDTAQ